MNWRLLAALTLAMSWSPRIFAAYYVEPYGGYELGNYQMQGGAVPNGSVRGLSFGTRAGLSVLDTVFVTLDGRYGFFTDSPTAPGSVYDGQANEKSLGVTAGIDFPLLLRVWMGYNFIDQRDYSVLATQKYSSYTLTGSSTKFGVGFSPLPLFSLNMEYILYDHTKVHWSGGSLDGKVEDIGSTAKGDMTRNDSAVLFTVSIPLFL